MTRDLEVEALQGSELGQSEISLWRAFREQDAAFSSPYFDPRFALAAAEVCPGGRIAVVHRAGRIEGFFPFQERGGLIQPLGAPLSDYNGVIARPGTAIDHAGLIRKLGAQRFRFSGMHAGALTRLRLPDSVAAAPAMVADLTGGYDAWLERRREAGQGRFFKDKRRRLTRLTEEAGAPEFSLGLATEADLDHVIAAKRRQFAQEGQHDVFACGWTRDLLATLIEHSDADFGLRVAKFQVGGQLIAAELGLLSGSAYHLWFPVYDQAYAQYSPGQLMTLETLRAAADLGIERVDFGAGGEAYKTAFAEAERTVYEGAVLANSIRAALASAPALRRQRIKLERRIDRIVACETTLSGRARAFGAYAGVVAKRHGRLGAAGAGLTASLGLTLTLAID